MKKNTKKEYVSKRDFKVFATACPHIPASLLIESIYCAHATEKTVHFQGSKPTPGPKLYSIFINLQGSGTVEKRSGKKVRLDKPGAIHFACNQNLAKLYSNNERWDSLVYHFYTDTLTLPEEEVYLLQNFNSQEEELFCNHLIRLMQMNSPINVQKANALLCARIFTWLESTSNVVDVKKEANLDRVLAYINANIYEPLHINTMAKDLNLNVKYIQRLFEEKVGVAPKEYITKVKLGMVYSLLKANNLSIKDIAKICSFSSPSHLINSFKQAEGISPSRYRKNFLESQ